MSMKKNNLLILLSVFVFASCSQNKLQYFGGDSIFISDNNDVYVAGSGCKGTSKTDRPLLWINGIEQTIGGIGNFNRAKSVYVDGNDVYVTMNTDAGAILWNNGTEQILSSVEFDEANSVCVDNGKVYVGGQAHDAAVIWVDGVQQTLSGSCVNEVAIHNGDVYAVGYEGDYFNGTPCLWINGKKTVLPGGSGIAHDIAFYNNDVYIAGECQKGTALWKNGTLVFSVSEKSGAYAVAVNGEDVYLGGHGFGTDMRPIALLWKNGVKRQILEMRSGIDDLMIKDNKLYISGSTKSMVPIMCIDL